MKRTTNNAKRLAKNYTELRLARTRMNPKLYCKTPCKTTIYQKYARTYRLKKKENKKDAMKMKQQLKNANEVARTDRKEQTPKFMQMT